MFPFFPESTALAGDQKSTMQTRTNRNDEGRYLVRYLPTCEVGKLLYTNNKNNNSHFSPLDSSKPLPPGGRLVVALCPCVRERPPPSQSSRPSCQRRGKNCSFGQTLGCRFQPTTPTGLLAAESAVPRASSVGAKYMLRVLFCSCLPGRHSVLILRKCPGFRGFILRSHTPYEYC